MSKKIKLSNLIPDDKNNNKHTAYGMDLLVSIFVVSFVLFIGGLF